MNSASLSRSSDRAIALTLLLGLGMSFAVTLGFRSTHSLQQHASLPAASHDEDSCRALSTRLCQDLGDATPTCALARSQTSRFASAHCAAMATRYSQVLSELKALDEGVREITSTEQQSGHVPAPSIGSPTAKLTLVEFCDFETSDCGRASPMAHMISNLYSDRVRLVFRQYPSPKHPHAELAAEASLAAHAQGKFWEFHDVLFSNPQDQSRPALERYAAAVGLDLIAFRRALDERTFAADVSSDLALGHRLQALDRPSLFANGKPVAVPYGVSELEKLVDGALSAR